MAIATCMWASAQGATVWVDARDFKTAHVPEAGEYALWVWIPADTTLGISIAGKSFSVAHKGGKKESGWAWVNAGVLRLKQGPLELAAPPEAAAIALSTHPAFDAAKAYGERRVFDTPRAADDRRTRTVRHTDTVFSMPHFASRDSWESFADQLRRRILLSSGLYPLPEKTPLNAQVFGRIEHGDYSVEKVYFEARPGLLVTGNLYRPAGPGPFPAVICPHGHWEHGRIENGERGSVPGRCITLARMGAVVFSYDMTGYNDSLQFPHNWGSAKEKLWGLHPFAVQLWASIRAIDFVQSLSDVDPERIGCTGASGGGTQTFAVSAVDPRVKVAAPVNMISSTMQGGCLCENAPIIRMINSNMEIGALMAPRPLLLVSASGDWTRETPHVEYPAIRSIYALYGAEDRLQNVPIVADHNYNKPSREAMYRFFGKWLLGGEHWADYTEPDFQPEPDADLLVFPDKKLPEGFMDKTTLVPQIIAATHAKWDAVLPKNDAEIEPFRKQYASVLADVLGTTTPGPNDLDSERLSIEQRGDYVLERWIIARTAVRDAVPALFYRAQDAKPQDAVLLVHGEGKAAFADPDAGGPGPLVAGLISRGKAVLCIDAFLTGEHHPPCALTERLKKGNFMDTFQPTDTGCRIQDILTAAAFLRARRDMTGNVNLGGFGAAGIWCLFASALDGRFPATLADLNGFPWNDDDAWVDAYYIPCIRSIGDVRTAAAFIAPDRKLTLMNPDPATGAWPGMAAESGLLKLPRLLELL